MCDKNDRERTVRLIQIYNLTGAAVVLVLWGFINGVPLGLEFAGRPFREPRGCRTAYVGEQFILRDARHGPTVEVALAGETINIPRQSSPGQA